MAQLEAELKRAAMGRVAAPDFWSPMGPNVRQSFHVLWRSDGGAATSSVSTGFVPNGQLLWELTRPYCGLSRCERNDPHCATFPYPGHILKLGPSPVPNS